MVMIIAGLGLLFSTTRHQHARTLKLMGASWLIIGAAWLLPSGSAQVVFMGVGTAFSVAVVIHLMISTWRQASIHQ